MLRASDIVQAYARAKIAHVWLVDPRDRTVEVFRLGADGYVLLQTWGSEDEPASLDPFAAVPIAPTSFWGKRRRPKP